MHRSLDFTPVEDEVIVARMLTQLHHAIDEAFPNAQPASARFARTAFTGYDEPTLTQVAPNEALREAAEAGRLELLRDELADPDLRHGFSQSSRRQTMIGLILLLIVGLIAYFASHR